MPRLCERPGCSAVATASYQLNPATLSVWIDVPSRDVEYGVGLLCRRHAEALAVPRGWHVDDRREPSPRLFLVPAKDATGDETAARGLKRVVKAESPSLFDSATDDSGLEETRAIAWAPHFEGTAVGGEGISAEPLADDEKPTGGLLGRAFGNKDRRER